VDLTNTEKSTSRPNVYLKFCGTFIRQLINSATKPTDSEITLLFIGAVFGEVSGIIIVTITVKRKRVNSSST
jgi:hypothetical protein